MIRDLFDRRLRALRRDRAARIGPELVLYDRAFDDCLDRLRDISRSFDRALLIGCPSPDWPRRLAAFAGEVEVVDPGTLFAQAVSGKQVEEDRFDFGEGRYDLCVAAGTLDSVNDLPHAFRSIALALRKDAPLIGAIAGGNSLATLRTCLIETGRETGRIAARTHPRIDASSLSRLLTATGFSMPVVDVDRVTVRYPNLAAMVRDLRAMAATSTLLERAPPLTKSEAMRLHSLFSEAGRGGRTDEVVEILHFLGWKQ